MATTPPRTQGLTGIGEVRKPVIIKPEHIKRGILILLGLAAFLTIAAVIKGISQSQSFKEKQELARTQRQLEQDKAAAANAKSPNRATTFQQDVATFQKNPAAAGVTTTTSSSKTVINETGDGTSPEMLDAMKEERLRAYRDIRAPLAIAIPDGNKPAASTSSGGTSSSRAVAVAPGTDQSAAVAAPQAEAVDPEMQALLQKRSQLVEQLRLLEAQNAAQNGAPSQ